MSRHSTIEVSLEDFELDDIIDYLEHYGYAVCKKNSDFEKIGKNEYSIRELAELIVDEEFRQCSLLFWRDLLTEILHISSDSGDDKILKAIKGKLN